jgi:hypothetical protein
MAYLKPTVGEMFQNGVATGAVVPAGPVPDLAAPTSAPAAGAAPTKAEFDKTVADLAATRATLNGLLASLRLAGFLTAMVGL